MTISNLPPKCEKANMLLFWGRSLSIQFTNAASGELQIIFLSTAVSLKNCSEKVIVRLSPQILQLTLLLFFKLCCQLPFRIQSGHETFAAIKFGS
uniref:Uncharacterized protein n=1 Tax=Meloidogyne enterolobii TaxID=390850 RepID=A0A6V7TWY7_MELEN|nr:unnamed protein product [Meloidogyne enterolobii]